MLLNILLSILVIDAVALTGVILLQRSEGGALGMGGGGGAFLSARGAGDLLTRTTAVLATLMFLISIAITLITGHNTNAGSVADRADALNLPAAQAPQQQQPSASGAAPTAPPLPGATTAGPPPLPTEAPRPVVSAPVRAAPKSAAPAPVRVPTADALANIKIPRRGAPLPTIAPAAPASSTPQQ
jgi:preprotein translocase subunit SecG